MANRMQTTQSSSRQNSPAGASTQSLGASGQAAPDHLYGVVSVLYHALQGAETYQQYIDDARQAQAPEVEQFFDACRKEEHERAERAKALLLDLLEDEQEDMEEATG